MAGLADAALALGPSQEVQPIPYGLVSLWDMINFSLKPLLSSLVYIRHFQSEYASKTNLNATLSSEEYDFFMKAFLNHILPPLRELRISEGRTNNIIKTNRLLIPTYGSLEHELRALDSDITFAAEAVYFYHYPQDKALMIFNVSTNWGTTIAAFPSAEEDVRAAVDCFALGHNHASIYHCMMVLERGLPALAKRLKVTVKKARPTWKDMIDDIRREIDARRNSLATPPRGSRPLSNQAAKRQYDFLGLCGEAAIEFRFFEHAWRNHIAHGRANYDENDAKKVLDHVCAFMDLGASKLNLKEN